MEEGDREGGKEGGREENVTKQHLDVETSNNHARKRPLKVIKHIQKKQ